MAKAGKTRFVKNPVGWHQMEKGARTTKAMVDIAEKIAQRAERNGGRFTEGYEGKAIGPGKARAGTDHPFAHWDEWGNAYRSPRAPLRRALGSLGLSVKGGG